MACRLCRMVQNIEKGQFLRSWSNKVQVRDAKGKLQILDLTGQEVNTERGPEIVRF